MGFLDLPAPFFAWLDGMFAVVLGPLARLALWAAAISALSMALYAVLSPQAELKRLKRDIRTARKELSAFEGDFDGVRALARRSIGLSLRHLRLVAPAALAACIPVVMLIFWLSKAYGSVPTETGLPLGVKALGGGAEVQIVEPASMPAGLAAARGPHSGPVLRVVDMNGREIAVAPLSPTLSRLEKRRWWHWLAGNTAGYLPPDAPLEAVRIDWPRREMYAAGPNWLRGWETPFLALAVVFTLGIQAAFRIE